MNLYQLTEQEKELQAMLMAGDIDEQAFVDTIEGMGIADKLESYCHIIRNLTAFAKACEEEKKRMQEKQKVAENGAERLKGVLLSYLTATEKAKAKAGLFSISRGSRKSIEVLDWKELPEEVLTPQPPKIDKVALKKLMDEGHTYFGAEYVEKEFITIR